MCRLSLLVAVTMIEPSLFAQSQPARKTVPNRSPQYVSNQLLVRYRPQASMSARAALDTAQHASEIRSYSILPGLQLVQVQPGVSLANALAAYRSDPNVLYADYNYVRRALDTPNDPYFHDLWGLHNLGQPIAFPTPPSSGPTAAKPGADIHAFEAWTITTGSSSVVIGIIDTGVDYRHEDLAANMFRNEADCNSNGVDDDGNGYVDDCYGIDTVNHTSDPKDIVGHGTHVAGTIGAVGNNGLGVTGINWSVKLLPCSFLGYYGGTDAGAIECLDYMAKMKDRGVNIVATNNSWGGYGYSQALYDAIDAQRQRGILFVAAAGNDTNDNDGAYPMYPASYSLPNLIAVAATSFDDSLAYFSNFGAHSVHLAAPGDYILSTTPDSTYSYYSGTSMATPHVTGAVGLLKAQDPARDWKALRNLILAGADSIPAAVQTVSRGRLNAFGSLTCQNKTVFRRVQPTASVLLASAGQPVTLAALNINCGAGAGPVSVSVMPGSPVTLVDNGAPPDQNASDGTYSATWTPPQSGMYTLNFGGSDQPLTLIADPYAPASTAFQYRTFTGTSLALEDESYGFIEPPFPLSFAGGAYEGIYVSDNGYLSFDSLLPTPASGLPYRYANTAIAPFWDNLVPASGGNVYWTVNGTAPNRELVVEWRKMSHARCKLDGSETATFQAVLFENTTDILFNYLDTTFGGTCTASDSGASAGSGVQSNPTTAKQYSLDTSALRDNTAVLWKSTLAQNPVPTITSLYPKSWYPDVIDVYVELTGTNFGSNAVVLVNGKPRPTYIFSSSDLLVDIPPADLTKAGDTLQLAVFNGAPAGGPSAAALLPLNAPDFALATSASSMSVKTGQSSSMTVYVYANPVFNNGVSLTCSGLPANATCSFDPSRILAGGYATLTISAKSPTASVGGPVARATPWGGLSFLAFPVAALLFGGTRRRLSKRLAMLAVLLVIALAMFGCGGGASSPPPTTNPSTPPTITPTTGSFVVTITGTSGSTQHTMAINVTIS